MRLPHLPHALYEVKKSTLKRRNLDIIEWSLIATCDIKVNTFLGFYTGSFKSEAYDSLYSAQLDDTHIYPFEDESNISEAERRSKPFANMNEPNESEHANCCFVVQDFKHDEVQDIQNIPNHERALYFRGLACFSCIDIKKDDELTWYYGDSYEPNRIRQGYKAGKPCTLLLQKQAFIEKDSLGVLSVLPKIPSTYLIAVIKSRKSLRFPHKKKRKKTESEDNNTSDSSSGSGHEIKYKPDIIGRGERLKRRNMNK